MRALAKLWALFCGIMLASLGVTAAQADSWIMPTTKKTLSDNGAYRVTIIPRDLQSQLDYFEDAVDGRDNPGQKAGSTQTKATAFLEHKGSDGKWDEIWRKPLVNDVAPVSALVSSDGKYVITFDNWHSVGYGDDVIAIYGADGALIRKHSLEDILPRYYVAAFPTSVSSRWWSGDKKLLANQATLQMDIVFPNGEMDRDAARYVKLNYDLANGAVTYVDDAQWREARAFALGVAKSGVKQQRAYIASERAPLLAPSTGKEDDWMSYAYDASVRLGLRGEERPMMIIFAPDDESSDDWNSRKQLFDVLKSNPKKIGSGEVIIATPSQPALVQFLEKETANSPKRNLQGLTFKVFAQDAYWPRIRDLLSRTGAQVVQLPMTPIAQSEEGLKQLDMMEVELDKIEQSYPTKAISFLQRVTSWFSQWWPTA